ncbi:cupin domain-containing protein [Alistipes sp. dk3620]|jgi:quercetin dioxygenase-like cupin family protein|uniref:Cupin domain-containing protein n=2 Tax=Rikenellaceae TaxID=171550 RepID=A0ABR7CJJ5_9BACT|nr:MULTISPECIES: cupin domain-containing protein [Alistipes]MBC5615405.1 cupin domain-containing protein [Alistipes hominis]MBS1415333.1 cupin domain-containing protein [Alistipes sp.]MQX27334.1 cupin domain-containing protein [Alistipes sp. dk3620]QGA22399.1 cupin domain-containing protein [Alistipes sp. dk3624]RHR63127.1 cupin domain-containing protein [Alistipes sp. AF17-16]
MLSRLFVLNVANLCSCPFNENILKTNNEKAINLKSRKMTKIKIVVHKKDALKKVFKGVSLDSLAIGEKSMVAKMNYVKGNFATTHQHPHEQCGYVISGEYRLKVEIPEENIDILLHAGDSYAIPGNTPHSFEVIEGGEVVDVFTPQREDYL